MGDSVMRPGMGRRSLYIAFVPAAGRNAGGFLRSSPFFLSVWPRSWRSVHSVHCHRGPAHHICHTRRHHDASHSVPALYHASARDMARRPCRLLAVADCRNACIDRRLSVPDRSACSCRGHSCGIVQHLYRCIASQRPWPSHGVHAPLGAAVRRRDGTRCDRARASPCRLSDTCRGRSARR